MIKRKIISFDAKRALESYDATTGQEMFELIDTCLVDALTKTNILRNAGVPIASPLLSAALSNKTKKVSLKEFLVGSKIPDQIPLDFPFKIIKKLKNLTPLIQEKKWFPVGDGIEVEILTPDPKKFEIEISGIRGAYSSVNLSSVERDEGETAISVRASFSEKGVHVQPGSEEMSLDSFMACRYFDPNEENVSMKWNDSWRDETTTFAGGHTGHFTEYHSSYRFEGFNLKNVVVALLDVLLPLTV
ncbi:MAG: hypothetical protein HQ564_01155 [Candidatus Saganbacteria bacterium]|nr:hypothetical protein [Candidatus Saganbacteria bacterium]